MPIVLLNQLLPSLSSCHCQAITVVLRDVKQAHISEDELKLLLGYVEEDIHDYQRQLTAFPLLRVCKTHTESETYLVFVWIQSILGRKFVVDDIHKLMYKIAQLSVTSDSDTTRLQCRQVPILPYTHSIITVYTLYRL